MPYLSSLLGLPHSRRCHQCRIKPAYFVCRASEGAPHALPQPAYFVRQLLKLPPMSYAMMTQPPSAKQQVQEERAREKLAQGGSGAYVPPMPYTHLASFRSRFRRMCYHNAANHKP
jgi:hypothetical protein